MSSKVAAAFAATRLPIFRQALANPFRTALIAKGTTFTYGQLLANAEVVRKRVLKGRIDPADPRRIAFLYPPGFDYVSAQWGIWAAGAISVPLCTSHPPPELEYTVTDSGADTVFFGKEFSEKIGALQKTLTGVKWIDLLGKDESGGLVQEIAAEPVIAQSQGALLIYTSGTTGKPKGVLTTHANIGAQAQSLITAWKWQAEDRLLHVLPLHHIHGIINALTCPLWLGASCEFMKFDARAVWDRWMRSERNLTIFMAVPTVYAKLIQEYEKMDEETQVLAREACSQFRLMVSGSAALPDPVFKAWEKISGHKLLERYGMTEIGMALGNPLEGPRIPGTVGFPFPGVKISLRDDNGKVVDPSHKDETSGELFVGGPQVFVKYWNRPDATASDLRDGWFRTGDMVARTPDGVHRILGRSSVDVIKTGGYKVSALEIERELFAHCDVADVAVLGIPDDTWGETICCLLVLKDGNDEEKTVETLKASLKAIMAPYKVPRKWKVIKELPRNAMGKVNKKALKPQFQDV
ncbi:hypothetical protein HKX48_009025 [Thoreauomyces humboldtii]|nr:hypothetical protein HKX48_009025 [Thoreauomyces humboldtii]